MCEGKIYYKTCGFFFDVFVYLLSVKETKLMLNL